MTDVTHLPLEAGFGVDLSMLKAIGSFRLDRLDGFPRPRAEIIDLIETRQPYPLN